MRIRLPQKWEVFLLSEMAFHLTSCLSRTLRVREVNSEDIQARLAAREGQILVTWHGQTLIPMHYMRDRGVVVMVSPSRDGDIQARVFDRYGWQPIRGSTSRGGARALMSAVKHLREGRTLALAPDGPRGPAEIPHTGAVFMAWKSGCPLVPAGISAWPHWHMKSWDRYLVPRPFARTAIVFGEPIIVPPESTEEDIIATRWDLRDSLVYLTARAEEMVRGKGCAS